jgi:small subunit ribosomal protein S2
MLASSQKIGFAAQVRKAEDKKERKNMEATLKEMLEAGVHFGHQKSRWNPKMSSFIFTERNGVHIFDLNKTAEGLEEALKFVQSIVKNGGTVLFVGTKKQAQEIIKRDADSCGMPYVIERWFGGMLTNFETFLSLSKTLKDLKTKIEKNDFATKKQLVVAKKKEEKLETTLGGTTNLKKLPDALYVVDVTKEVNAVKEAKKLGIPVIGLVDTNADPTLVDYVIPANDDAVKSISLITGEIAKAIGSAKPVSNKDEQPAQTTEEA